MTTHFDIICLPESWYDETILDAKTVQQNVFRRDRLAFMNKRKNGGGGVVTLINEDFQSEDIQMAKKIVAEIQGSRITRENTNYVEINAYLPAYGNRLNMVN